MLRQSLNCASLMKQTAVLTCVNTVAKKQLSFYTQRSCVLSRSTSSCKFFQKPFHTSTVQQRNDGNEDDKPKERIHNSQTILNAWTTELGLFAFRLVYDSTFNRRSFKEGAKQAVMFACSKLHEGNLDNLDDVVTPNGKAVIEELYEEYKEEKDIFKLDGESHIQYNAFQMDHENDKKIAVITMIVCHLDRNLMNRTAVEMDRDNKYGYPMRFLWCSLARDYTDGPDTSSWWLHDLGIF